MITEPSASQRRECASFTIGRQWPGVAALIVSLERYAPMKAHHRCLRQILSMKFAVVLALSSVISAPLCACTIFVLTDTNQALFCNNEDWSNPKARIWFVPAGTKHYGWCMSALMTALPKAD